MAKKPKKPTEPTGTIQFSKDGKVTSKIFKLPDEKEPKEKRALEIFVQGYNKLSAEFQIEDFEQLSEYDQDFLLTVNEEKIEVQLTELVDRSFNIPLTEEEYLRGDYTSAILKDPEKPPLRTDKSNKVLALTGLLRQKIGKNYAKSEGKSLWLLIFTTAPYEMEYFQGGQLRHGEALMLARHYLDSEGRNVFDEIWFTNLITRPVKIWPPNSHGYREVK